jgi:hypothetical protein
MDICSFKSAFLKLCVFCTNVYVKICFLNDTMVVLFGVFLGGFSAGLTLMLSHGCPFVHKHKMSISLRGHHGHDRMVVGFTTTCVISAYHH